MPVRTRERTVLGLALLFSGAAALVYESAWGRMLQRVFGVSDWAVATVLASFFLGMGLGSALGGRLARRIRRPARAYAAIEVAVALWALGSLAAIPRIHHVYASLGPDAGFATLSLARFVLSMLVLLPPTIGMGATLPVLVRGFEARPDFVRDATWLYTINTLGAALGAGLTGFLLLPELGVRASIAIAAIGSTAAAVTALLGLGSRSVEDASHEPTDEHEAARRAPAPADDADDEGLAPAPRLVALLAFASGLLSLGGEVLFTRLLRIVIQGTSQAFAAMLVCYLLGIAGGSAIARSIGRSPNLALSRFGGAQLVAATLVALGIGSASWLPRIVGLVRGEPELVPHETSVILAIAMMALLPIALAVGTGLPLVMGLLARRSGARGTGRVLATNTLGGLVGSLVAGFVAVPAIGLEASLYALVVLHATLALAALVAAAGDHLPSRLTAFVASAAVMTATLVLRPSIHLPFLLDGSSDASRAIVEGPSGYDVSQLVFVREGRNTTVSVVDREDVLRLFNDGRPESGIAAGTPAFGPELVMLGGLPGLLASERERAMVIGLGAGHSASLLLAGEFAQVDVVELEPAVVDAARLLHRMRGHTFPLDDRRAHLVVDDARARLGLAAAGSYDAIVSQPSHPWLAGVSALYTREFFLEAKRALRPGGVLSLWVNVFRMDVRHLRAVVATLHEVFPHAAAFVVEDSSFLVVASERPLALGERITTRFGDAPRLREFFAGYQLDTAADVLAHLELDESGIETFARGGARLVDDRPALEYGLSRIPHDQSLFRADLDAAFRDVPWITRRTQSILPAHLRATLPLHRVALLEARRTALLRVRDAVASLELTPDERGLVEGGVAEMLGDVGTALARYDASEHPEAITRAAALRVVDGRADEALEHARSRANAPDDATPLLRAALAGFDREDLAFALASDVRSGGDAEGAYRALAAAVSAGGCAGALTERIDAASLDPVTLDRLADCAARFGTPDDAARRTLDAAMARRALAQVWFDRGQTAYSGGNLALALRFFRRTLALWPSHRDAAERAMDALCALDRCEEARNLVEATVHALRFARGQDEALRTAAARHGLAIDP